MQNAAHERAFNHLVESLNNPQLSQSNQSKFNDERLQKVKDSLVGRPQFLPVQITLPPAAQTFPVSETTSELKFDVIITGAITDGEGKQVNLKRDTENGTPFVSVGTEAGAKISLDALAGKSLEASGVNGIQPLPPFLLRAGEGLTLEIYKPDATTASEVVSIVFVGYRVFSQAVSNESFNDKIKAQVTNAIAQRATPEPRFSVCPVTFDADGTATAETPKTSEPRLILGFRSTFKNALVNLGFDTNTAFSRDLFPIWALASEDGDNSENYRMLKSPIFREPQQQLYFTFLNSINGTVFAENGQIEVLETTV